MGTSAFVLLFTAMPINGKLMMIDGWIDLIVNHSGMCCICETHPNMLEATVKYAVNHRHVYA